MKLPEIVSIANFQKNNWTEIEGTIDSFDLGKRELVCNGLAFSMNETAIEQTLDRLELLNTRADFKTDGEFMQKAINRKIETISKNTRKNPSLIIFDQNTKVAKCVKTTGYKRIHSADILTRVLNNKTINVEETADDAFSYIDDDRFYLVFNRGKFTVKDEILHFGTRISNSETGILALSINQWMLRQVCTNGATVRLGGMSNRFAHRYLDIWEKFDDAIAETYTPTRYLSVVEQAITSEPTSLDWDSILKILKIPSKYQAPIEANFAKDKLPKNRWGIYNAITRMCRDTLPLAESHLLCEKAELALFKI